jgi:hypothetical protein
MAEKKTTAKKTAAKKEEAEPKSQVNENKDETPAEPVEAVAKGADAPETSRNFKSSRDETHRQLYGG